MPRRQDSPLPTVRVKTERLVGVEIGEVGLALLGLHILARRRARTGDRRRMCALAEIAQDALDGTWLGDGSDDAHSGVTVRAVEHVGQEDAAQKIRPWEAVGCGPLSARPLPRRPRCVGGRNDLRPVTSGGRQEATSRSLLKLSSGRLIATLG
jgi:hypothetical protein